MTTSILKLTEKIVFIKLVEKNELNIEIDKSSSFDTFNFPNSSLK